MKLAFGYNGRVLHVDLSAERIEVENVSDEFYRTYMGGSGLIGYYLLKMMKPGIDPLGPDNVLVFAPGALTGAPLGGMCRFAVGAKSPLTNAFGQSEAGGFWGPELKRAGFDGIVIRGKACKPVYLYINDGDVSICGAGDLWGKKTGEVQDAIRDRHKDPAIRVAQIGPGGENLVRYACITNELKHFNGRNGLGAVMGSKNLKAIAVRGKKQIPIADHKLMSEISKKFGSTVMENPLTRGLYESGTAASVLGNNAAGILPTKNFRYGEFDRAEAISAKAMNEKILVAREGCYACPVRCKRAVKSDRYGVEPRFGGPEYETLASFGSLCLVDDIEVIAKANQMCNEYTLDTISTGMTIAFAMECFEANILTGDDTDGIELTFGNGEALLAMIEKIAKREGFGDVLAEGSKRASEIIGKGSEKFVLTAKGQELPMHEPRGKYSLALAYAASERGADHMVAAHDTMVASKDQYGFKEIMPLGILEPESPTVFSNLKVRTFAYLSMWWSFFNAAGICDFVPVPRSSMPIKDVVDAMCAFTGWQTSAFELMKVGERALVLARMFNAREGFDVKEDTLPERLFSPLEKGPLSGNSLSEEEFQEALQIYYAMMNWDERGIPTRGKLSELGLDWIAEDDGQGYSI
ncbi:aldehyde ferredoxin oxidoreductase family protein [Acetomicrobium thermoterrenum]|uniref:aldehyde ferredoxin oxidoreductase family protein n=1 Tax=Acetomicrobium thermoterrenum TaxID=1120986 RepID=UPI000B858C7D|nr:aldehyde ferredoxin oxidoreductase family protein [Acetomicrobium thermoterrenum]